jgi:glyoxylase-like metal-dependent hydrolase (beta-lactamase superfamily II)
MRWSWTLLRAGAFRLDGGSMFGVVPKALWARRSPPDAENRIALQCNCLLLESGGRRVLVETGYGDKWDARGREMFAMEERSVRIALAEVGVAPEQIDAVIVTHLHFDHAGGLTTLDEAGRAVPSFPRAEVIVQRQEWEDALANRSTMGRTYLRDHLDPIADRVRLIEGEAEVLPGLVVWPMVGHTWGQQALRFEDEAGVICFPGDVMPTIEHAGLAWNMAYDMLPFTNMQSKTALLNRALAEAWRILIDHEPGAPLVRVVEPPEKPGARALQRIEIESIRPTGEKTK